jgi:hypothetical protein
VPYCVMYVYRLPPVFQRFRKSSRNNFGTKRPVTVGGNRLTIREHCYKSCRKGCLVVLDISHLLLGLTLAVMLVRSWVAYLMTDIHGLGVSFSVTVCIKTLCFEAQCCSDGRDWKFRRKLYTEMPLLCSYATCTRMSTGDREGLWFE